jgi:hypothetical protein
MVNKSTNINKTNNHLSPQTTEYQKKTMTYGIRNPCLGLAQAQKYGRVKPVNVICFVSMTLGNSKDKLECKKK